MRLQSGLLRSDSQVPYRVGRSNSVSSSRPSRPRSLESDILLLRYVLAKYPSKIETQPQSTHNSFSARTFQPMKMDLSSTQTDFDKQLEMVQQQQQLKEIVLFHFKMRFQPIRAQDLK